MSEPREIDVEVLRLLGWDGRMRNAAIAARLGIKEDRVGRIIGRLRKAELIKTTVRTACPPLWSEDRRPASERRARLTAAGLKASVPWQLAAKECLRSGALSEKEREFLTDLSAWFRRPSEKQLDWLDRLVDAILGTEAYR